MTRRNLRHAAFLLSILLIIAWLLSFSFLIRLQNEFSHLHSTLNSTPNSQKKSQPNTSKDVHIVFSTDCSGYQHWQSLAAYYSIKRSGHLGSVTRVASGCSTDEQEKNRLEMKKIDHSQYRVHFTPSFALSKGYKYSNKPGGLNHWILNTIIEEGVIALIDPDMMLLRPILPELGDGLTVVDVSRNRSRADLVEYKDAYGKVHFLRKKNLPDLPLRVREGMGAGQHFGIGTLWVSAGTSHAKKDFQNFNLTAICGKKSPCLNTPNKNNPYTTREQAENYYSVGPVYISSTSDWKTLLPRWHEFTPLVHDQYPKLLAEMYAFTMAAADRQLKFDLASSWMVSDTKTMSPTESWIWIDEYGMGSRDHARSVCEGATVNSLPTETLGRLHSYGYGRYGENVAANNKPLPVTLHYCQRYLFANHTFAKRKLSHDFFRCDGEPLVLDVDAILNALDATVDKVQKRIAFMVCHLIPLMNMALEDYKADVC